MSDTNKWYLRPGAVVIGILVAGVFALPLLWFSPAFKRWQKWVLSILVLLLTVWLVKTTGDVSKVMLEEFRQLQSM